MQVFDASSMIYAWDNYPMRQFPGLWEWMAAQIAGGQLVMPSVAFEEVADKTPDCGEWLKGIHLKQLAISNVILQDAMRIKSLLAIVGDNYHPNGVGENDIFIIATARAQGQGVELISDEAKQPIRPKMLSRYKIPAVCDMTGVAVTCFSFIDYLKRSDEVFR